MWNRSMKCCSVMSLNWAWIFIVSLWTAAYSQQPDAYEFKALHEIPHLPVIGQHNTGTCWSFSMVSFFEAEILRKTGKSIDLSEMYIVRNAYRDKAWTTIMRRGQLPFNEGALNPDAIHSAERYGLVPQSVYSGVLEGRERHDHRILHRELKKLVEEYSEPGDKPVDWKQQLQEKLDEHLGAVPESFVIDEKEYSPSSFLAESGLNLNEYVHVSSFAHRPFYKPFVLDIPDNFSNELFQNVPLEEWIAIADHAIQSGFSFVVEMDVDEPCFSGKQGVALVPLDDNDRATILIEPRPEKEITQELRQQEYEALRSSNDHNVHVVGTVVDRDGKRYFKVKNSWSPKWGRDGYFYMSESYFRLKVFYISVHRDAIPAAILEKMKG